MKERYRRISARIYGDEKFRALSPSTPCGQSLFLYLLTGPHTGPIPGLSRASAAALADELGWSLKAFMKAFAEIEAQGMARADFAARLLWLPNALKHNAPGNPNVVKGWAQEIAGLPECPLKREAIAAIREQLQRVGDADAFVKAFDEVCAKAFGKALANQEAGTGSRKQDQQQEGSPPDRAAGEFSRAREATSAELPLLSKAEKPRLPRGWYASDEGVIEAGRLLGLEPRRGESAPAFKSRVENAVQELAA